LDVTALVGIDRDRITLAEVPETRLCFIFESNGGNKVNHVFITTEIFRQSRVEIGSPSAVSVKDKAESFVTVLFDVLEEFSTDKINTYLLAQLMDLGKRITSTVLGGTNDGHNGIDGSLFLETLVKLVLEVGHEHTSSIVDCDGNHIAIADTRNG
jgi:hypothetical protein